VATATSKCVHACSSPYRVSAAPPSPPRLLTHVAFVLSPSQWGRSGVFGRGFRVYLIPRPIIIIYYLGYINTPINNRSGY
jgi:hypothetical protein